MEDRRPTGAPWLVLLVPVILLGGYVAGYFMLGTLHGEYTPIRGRAYEESWMIRAFEPLARIEELITGRPVVIGIEGPLPEHNGVSQGVAYRRSFEETDRRFNAGVKAAELQKCSD